MRPKTIALKDFISYRECSIDLDGIDMVALAGDNGAGKSALAVDALTWSLWGQSRGRSDDDIVRAGQDECTVSLTFEAADGVYRVVRRRRLPKDGKRGVSTLTLEKFSGEEAVKLTGGTIRETQELIDAAVGLDYRTFVNTACLVQGRADEFTRAEPRERKEVLGAMLGLDDWQLWTERARERSRSLQAEVGGIDAVLERIRSTLSGDKAELEAELQDATTQVDSLERTFDEVAAGEQTARAAYEEVMARAREIDQLAQQAQRVGLEIDQKKADLVNADRQIAAVPGADQIEELRQRVALTRQAVADLPELDAQLQRWQAAENACLEAERAAERLQQEETRAKEALDAMPEPVVDMQRCPTCGQKMAREAQRLAFDRMTERKAEASRRSRAVSDERISAIDKHTAAMRRRGELTAPPAELVRETQELARRAGDDAAALGGAEGMARTVGELVSIANRARVWLADVERGWGEAKANIDELRESCQDEGVLHDAHLRAVGNSVEVRSKLQESRTHRDELAGRLGQLAKAEEEAAELEARRTALAAEGALMADLVRAFGPNGVQAMMIDAAIPEIVDEANRLLAMMSASTTIDLRTTRAGKSTGREIDTLDVIISDTAGTRPYELYSGGERFRIDFAVRLGLSKLLARRAARPCRTLIVDEGFGSQDGRSKTALVEALATVRGEYSLIMVISHLAELKELFPSVITIRKVNDGSAASLS